MFNDLANKAFRHEFLSERIRVGMAFAIRAIRERAKMTQEELAEKLKTSKSVVSRYEDPNYGRFNLGTLLAIARVFDVALLVKFVPYSKFVAEHQDVSPSALAIKSYAEEKNEYQQQPIKQVPLADRGQRHFDQHPREPNKDFNTLQGMNREKDWQSLPDDMLFPGNPRNAGSTPYHAKPKDFQLGL